MMYRNFFKVLKQSLITDILLFFDNEGNMLNFLEILKLKSVSTMTCSNSLSSLPYMMLSQKMPNTQIILCPNFFLLEMGKIPLNITSLITSDNCGPFSYSSIYSSTILNTYYKNQRVF